ncbi:MAG: hypothetical protein WAL98_04940 [Desulfatiglandaceae bacterium]|jgi:hypothetical protein
MNPTNLATLPTDRRSEPRLPGSQFYSVELSIHDLNLSYQFKIWNIASQSMCVLVREDSELLTRLKVGDVMDMTYYTGSSAQPTAHLKTEIRHITKDEGGKFRGHYMVGISILNTHEKEVTH